MLGHLQDGDNQMWVLYVDMWSALEVVKLPAGMRNFDKNDAVVLNIHHDFPHIQITRTQCCACNLTYCGIVWQSEWCHLEKYYISSLLCPPLNSILTVIDVICKEASHMQYCWIYHGGMHSHYDVMSWKHFLHYRPYNIFFVVSLIITSNQPEREDKTVWCT